MADAETTEDVEETMVARQGSDPAPHPRAGETTRLVTATAACPLMIDEDETRPQPRDDGTCETTLQGPRTADPGEMTAIETIADVTTIAEVDEMIVDVADHVIDDDHLFRLQRAPRQPEFMHAVRALV